MLFIDTEMRLHSFAGHSQHICPLSPNPIEKIEVEATIRAGNLLGNPAGHWNL